MKSPKRVKVFAILGIVGVIILLAGVKAAQIGAMIKAGKSFAPPPESVASAKAETAEWAASRAAVGTLVAVHGVTLTAEITGKVKEISFESGSTVKNGAVLVRLDATTEQAQLEAAQADASLAKLTLNRAKVLRQGGANTPAEFEAAESRAAQANATVAALQSTIAKKTIHAPFDGRVAIRQVELGQILSPGMPITSIQSVSPIYAEFSLPQQSLAEIKVGQKVQMRTDIFPGASWVGEVTVINPEVDVATRNVRIRATFENQDGRLRPGMFVNVEAFANEKKPFIIIPATSVLFAPYGDSVYVLQEKKDPSGKGTTVAQQRFVRLGERRGDFVAVVSGLSPGEVVASSGAFKLRNGTTVAVNNSLQPPAELEPKPADK